MEEQQQQLVEIDQLLQDSPDDPSLLALRVDLLELIAVTSGEKALKINEAASTLSENEVTSSNEVLERQSLDEGHISGWSTADSSKSKRPLEDDNLTGNDHETDGAGHEPQTQQRPPKKKKKASALTTKEFVLPSHLQPDENDNKAEANRKKRAIKVLKNQWRTQRKEQEANQKQRSWQDFQKRAKSNSSNSMFATSTDAYAKVGVVGGRNMTDFASRKRHK